MANGTSIMDELHQKRYTTQDLDNLDHKARLKLINAVTGIKPGNLIGTTNAKGQHNLAIFSSVVHLGSDPALIGMIVRPVEEVPRHTYQNMVETGYYTINHIHPSFIKNAHYTSAKFEEEVSEFDRCGLTPEFRKDFKAPFVKESLFKMGVKLIDDLLIPQNKTRMVVGQIEQIILPEEAYTFEEIDLEKTEGVGISGLNTYYALKRITTFPYARANEVPDLALPTERQWE